MKALNDRVLVKLANMPEKTKGGVYLPTTNFQDGQAKINIGKVLAAGDGMVLRNGEVVPVKVKEGDVIVWEQFGGIRFEILGPKTVCIRSEDIGAILEVGEYEDGWFEDFADGQEKEHVDNLNRFREESAAAILSRPRMKTYQCWNNDCKDKLKPVERPEEKDQCETCGSIMLERQIGPELHVDGGTPRFHR